MRFSSTKHSWIFLLILRHLQFKSDPHQGMWRRREESVRNRWEWISPSECQIWYRHRSRQAGKGPPQMPPIDAFGRSMNAGTASNFWDSFRDWPLQNSNQMPKMCSWSNQSVSAGPPDPIWPEREAIESCGAYMELFWSRHFWIFLRPSVDIFCTAHVNLEESIICHQMGSLGNSSR